MGQTPIMIMSSSRILTYNKQDYTLRKKIERKKEMARILNMRFKGKLGMPSIKKIAKIIDTWNTYIMESKSKKFNYKKNKEKKLSLITLTLSEKQKHTDLEIKRNMLNRFILVLQKKYGLQNYIWKAEYQKNGNLHFHIVVDIYIHHKSIRQEWNKIQLDNGYLDNYFKSFGNYNPNSTDIHSCKNAKNVRKYICKYLTKNGEERENAGRIWGCSDSVRNLRPVEMIVTKEIDKLLNQIEQLETTRIKQTEYSISYYLDVLPTIKRMSKELHQEFIEQLFMQCFHI
jgi:hypothetical protein